MRRVAVRAIIIKDDQMLLVKLKAYNKASQGHYCTIGGGLDEGEDLVEGLKREVMEETGISAEVGRLLFVQQFNDDSDNLEFFFHVTNSDDFSNIDLSKTSHGQIEIAEIGFYDPKELHLLPAFLKDVSPSDILKSTATQVFTYS